MHAFILKHELLITVTKENGSYSYATALMIVLLLLGVFFMNILFVKALTLVYMM